MKKQKFVFSLLSFTLSLLTPGCFLFGLEDVALSTDNYLDVDLIKREYFVNEKVDLSDCIVKGVDAETSEKKEVNYTINLEGRQSEIRHGDTIRQKPGIYKWVFSSPGYKNYSIDISIYEAKSESFYISSFPIHQYFYSNSPTSVFSNEGLSVKRQISYETVSGEQLKKIYDIPLNECKITYRDNNQVIPITNGYRFPEGSKGVYTVSVTTDSYINPGFQTSPASYKINVTDAEVSTSLSLDDFDESSIVKYDTDDTMTLTITNSKIGESRNNGTQNYIAPNNVDNSFGVEYARTKNDENKIYCPSIGDVPVLVIPFYFNHSKSQTLLTNENLSLIESCFFGNSNDLYYESLKSYYYKSSYNQLNFYGKVAPPFNPQTDGSRTYQILFNADGLPKLNDNDMVPMMRDALSFVKRTGFDLRDFDSNGDGYIDALWLISFSPIANMTKESMIGWPHTNNILKTTPNISEPVVNMFSITPIGTLNNDFYRNITSSSNLYGQNRDGDAHTIIHETGHLLGLNDYYSTATGTNSVYEFETNGNKHAANYSPLGGLDFMDKNYLDLNPYSKLLLGWTKPYLVYGNSTITLKPSLYKNQVVVIPYDSLDYSSSSYVNSRQETIFNPYDEYLVLDFFTPDSNYEYSSKINDNLNTKEYDVYTTQRLTESGIRIYHVDKRGLIYSNDQYTVPSDPFSLLSLSGNQKLVCPITNTEYGASAEHGSSNRNGQIANIEEASKFSNYCDEIRILTEDPKEYVDSTYYIKDPGNNPKCNGVLFKGSNTFQVSNYTTQTKVIEFPNNMKDSEKKSSLSCFGHLSSLIKDLSPSDFEMFYLKIELDGYSKYYSYSQWQIVEKYYDGRTLSSSEQAIFNSLSVPEGFGTTASFNNGAACSYVVNIN